MHVFNLNSVFPPTTYNVFYTQLYIRMTFIDNVHNIWAHCMFHVSFIIYLLSYELI